MNADGFDPLRECVKDDFKVLAEVVFAVLAAAAALVLFFDVGEAEHVEFVGLLAHPAFAQGIGAGAFGEAFVPPVVRARLDWGLFLGLERCERVEN